MTTQQTGGPQDAGDPAKNSAPAPSVATAGAGSELAQADFARDAGSSTMPEYFKDYVSRVRGGEVGALPAVLGLVLLTLIFSQVSARFRTVYNLANLVTQAGITILIAMGLVFVLLLGEIDLSAGTASGVCAGLMAIALISKGDPHNALGTWTFLGFAVFMVAGAAIAGLSRLWYAVGITMVGLLMLLTGIGTGNGIGAIFLGVSFGVSIGLVTGLLVARLGIPSFVVTLALFLGWQGVLLQMIGNGSALPVGQFPLINSISNGTMPPLLSWIFFLVTVGGFTLYTVTRSIGRRRDGLSAEPISVVLARSGSLVVIGGVALYLLNQERSPNPFQTLKRRRSPSGDRSGASYSYRTDQ